MKKVWIVKIPNEAMSESQRENYEAERFIERMG